MTMEQPLRSALIEQLSLCFHSADESKISLVSIGFPRSRIPDYAIPYVFWHRVLDELESGIVEGGPTLLARELLTRYPGNETFEQYLNGLDSSPVRERNRGAAEAFVRSGARSMHAARDTGLEVPPRARRLDRCVFWSCMAPTISPTEMPSRVRWGQDGPRAWLSMASLCPAHYQELISVTTGRDQCNLVEQATLDSRLHFEHGAFQASLTTIQLCTLMSFALRDYDRAADALFSSLIQLRALGLTQQVSQIIEEHSWLTVSDTGHLWLSFPRHGWQFRSVRPFTASPMTRLRYLKEALTYYTEIEPSPSKNHLLLMVADRLPRAVANPFYGNIRASILSRSALILPRPRTEILEKIGDATSDVRQYTASLALYDFWKDLRRGTRLDQTVSQVHEIDCLELNHWTQLDVGYAIGLSLATSTQRQLRVSGLVRLLDTFRRAKALAVRQVPTASPAFGADFNPVSFAMRLVSAEEVREANESMTTEFYDKGETR